MTLSTLLFASCLATAPCLDTPYTNFAYFPGLPGDCNEAAPDESPVVLCRVDLDTEVRTKVKPVRKGNYFDILIEAASRNSLICGLYPFYSPGRF
jgi:hypothetical protein